MEINGLLLFTADLVSSKCGSVVNRDEIVFPANATYTKDSKDTKRIKGNIDIDYLVAGLYAIKTSLKGSNNFFSDNGEYILSVNVDDNDTATFHVEGKDIWFEAISDADFNNNVFKAIRNDKWFSDILWERK